MLGVGMGRLFEEDLANKFNMVLLQEMKRNYDIGVSEGTLDQFVNIADSDDPIHKDIWRTLGVRLKDDAAAIFGETKMLPVKRNMELDTVGYRAGSVREVWDDDSRMNKTFQKAFQDALVLPFGEKAYKRAVQAETLVQDAVSYAKTTIVVRSVVVMKENLVSNVLHLMSWGIGPVQALKGIITKFLETNQYVKNREKILELNAELAATGQNRKARERISAQIKVLTDIEKNLSIYPLIAAGEFNTISESLTEADTAIANGKLSNLIEQCADRLPGLARDAVKTLMITRDSALFKALNRLPTQAKSGPLKARIEHMVRV